MWWEEEMLPVKVINRTIKDKHMNLNYFSKFVLVGVWYNFPSET